MWLTEQFAPQMKSEFGFTETSPLVKAILSLWTLLMLPWLPVAGLSAMAFEAGYTFSAYVFACSIWLYPVAICIAFICRQKKPLFVLVPMANIAAWLFSGW